MRRAAIPAVAALVLGGLGTIAVAQQAGQGQGHDGMNMPGMMGGPGAATPASRGTMEAMQRMRHGTGMRMTGNADRDLIAMMIPHHQSAMEMARVVLQHGSDPEVRALAEGIAREQEREIAQMRAILQRLPAR